MKNRITGGFKIIGSSLLVLTLLNPSQSLAGAEIFNRFGLTNELDIYSTDIANEFNSQRALIANINQESPMDRHDRTIKRQGNSRRVVFK